MDWIRKMKQCEHDYEVIEKTHIYPKKNKSVGELFKTTTWTFSDDFLKLLLSKDITKEEILSKIELDELKKESIGIYVLQRCKKCGELKEFRSYFNDKEN